MAQRAVGQLALGSDESAEHRCGQLECPNDEHNLGKTTGSVGRDRHVWRRRLHRAGYAALNRENIQLPKWADRFIHW